MQKKLTSRLKNNFEEFYNKDFDFYISHKTLQSEEDEYYSYHWHDYFELEFVVSGKGEHIFDNISYKLGPGSIYIVSPVDFHSLKYDPTGPLEMYNIKFGSNALSPAVFRRVEQAQPPIMATLVATEYRYVVAEMKKLVDEFRAHRSDSELMLKAGFDRICLMVLRRMEHFGENMPAFNVYVAAEPTVKKIVSYVNYNFRSQISLQTVAATLDMTPNYLGELFKKELGLSFTEYVKKLRLEYSRSLLVNSELDINQVCFDSGFRTTSYFISCFKKQYGKTPLEYRLAFSKTQQNFTVTDSENVK